MLRFFTSILMLTIFFLVGMVLGMSQETEDRSTSNDHSEALQDYQLTNQKEYEINSTDIESEPKLDDVGELDSQNATMSLTLTQKTASFLERGIKGFSEVIVGILHQIALLFF
ncbi:hypothetical protein KQI49_06335 [Virgibacillus sp. MSJ-26]|uniref:hypothetical protein n=1 Tax=Virgibacillus sp. MSJ-26 TaxID=2841522 RepID=UPI001C120A6E|nr:hypothetical protein [Virgibacillus sp. MSJ-26]MBU5466448.1 hypothetical protein [Virgibacillus sp. MSJ-26]